MQAERIVIVGAGPAGFATARSYREHGGRGEVILLGQEPLAPYRRPPLTKELLRGEIDAGQLPLAPDDWFTDKQVQLRLSSPVHAIDTAASTVSTTAETLSADAIVLATGSEPVRPDLPGADDPAILTMRDLADSRRVAHRVSAGTEVLVLGTGFIGCEIAGSLAMVGAHVTLIGQEPAPQERRLGPAAADRIAGWLGAQDVDLVLGVQACGFENGRTILLKDGRRLSGECAVLGMGARPRVGLAVASGLPIHHDAVAVDSQMRASARCFAVGDIAFAYNQSAGRSLRVEHWGDALGQGEIAGRVLAGQDAHWRDVPGFWSTIAGNTLKYAAWGDGYDASDFVQHPGEAFTVRYFRDEALVGVLVHERDEDYEEGRQLILREQVVGD